MSQQLKIALVTGDSRRLGKNMAINTARKRTGYSPYLQ